MRKWLRNTLICLVCAGVTTTAGYFIGVEVSENIRLSKANETFVEKLENANNFNIKHLNMNFFDEVTSHYFSFKLNNLDLQIVDDENCNLKTDIQIFYDYMEIYSGSAVFLDKIFYLETNESSTNALTPPPTVSGAYNPTHPDYDAKKQTLRDF